MPTPKRVTDTEIQSEAQLQRLALQSLERLKWNQGDAAHAIGLRRESLNRKLKAWGGPDGLRRLVGAQHQQATQKSQPSQASQESHVIQIHDVTASAGSSVLLNRSAVESSLTSGRDASRLGDVNAVTVDRPEDSTVRIPPMSVDVDAEEDFFISQEVARGRLTSGGPRTRAAVVRKALRFYMDQRKREDAAGGEGRNRR